MANAKFLYYFINLFLLFQLNAVNCRPQRLLQSIFDRLPKPVQSHSHDLPKSVQNHYHDLPQSVHDHLQHIPQRVQSQIGNVLDTLGINLQFGTENDFPQQHHTEQHHHVEHHSGNNAHEVHTITQWSDNQGPNQVPPDFYKPHGNKPQNGNTNGDSYEIYVIEGVEPSDPRPKPSEGVINYTSRPSTVKVTTSTTTKSSPAASDNDASGSSADGNFDIDVRFKDE